MLTHEEKLTLIRDFISAGVTDADAIIHYIKRIEESLFGNNG